MENVTRERLDFLAAKILDCAFIVHRELGPGLFESIYQECLMIELEEKEISFSKSVSVPITYKGKVLRKKFVVDLLVDDAIIVELKAVEEIYPISRAQLLNYLRLTGKRLGLLINFNETLLKNGIVRMVNKY